MGILKKILSKLSGEKSTMLNKNDETIIKEFKKIVTKNKDLVIEIMINCQKILDQEEKFGATAAYKASTMIICMDSLMNIIASPYQDKIEEMKNSLRQIHQNMLMENKEPQVLDYISNPNFISNISKTLQ